MSERNDFVTKLLWFRDFMIQNKQNKTKKQSIYDFEPMNDFIFWEITLTSLWKRHQLNSSLAVFKKKFGEYQPASQIWCFHAFWFRG